jgi:NitT/TauT family transport system substrate-binding protein
MRRRKILQASALFAIGAVSSAALSSCGSRNEQSASPKPEAKSISTKPLRVAILPWIGFSRMHLAETQGFFKELGLNVEHVIYQDPTKINEDLVAKKVDLAWLVAVDLLELNAKDPNLKFIKVSDYSGAVDAIVGNGIASPSDLRGKTIARENIPYEVVFVEKYLQSINLTTDDVKIVSMTVSDAAAAFIAGKVDAAAIFEPLVTKSLKERAGSSVLFTAKGSSIIPNGLAGNSQLLNERREEVLAYLKAGDQALKYAAGNVSNSNEVVAKWVGSSVEEIAMQMQQIDLLDISANKSIAFNINNPLNVVASVDSAAPILARAGKSKPAANGKMLTGKDLIDDSFIKAL